MRRFLVAAGVVAALAVAGCGTTTAQPLGDVKLSAAEAIQQTAQKADSIDSYSADIVLDFADPKGQKGTVQGSMLFQQKPTLASDVTLSQVSFGGQTVPGGLRVVLADEVAYVKMDLLKTLIGTDKPWVKIDLKQLGDAQAAGQFLDQAQQIDLKTSVTLLTASKDVKAVGTESVNGVDTTHYAGTFPVEAAVLLLPKETQERVKGQLSQLKNVKFDAWIDGEGLPRKIGINGAEQGASFSATLLFKSFNEQLSIAAPPADQVGDLPKNMPVGG
uniref:LppX_LprAFG lipoprotein n=1 Tax=Herbidospora sakaeratensis TaxID=564415 RepID=UPI0007847C60|nr:LppX_LprAFG lipoprotein [Herbidospora sakaeratensis]